MRWLPDVEQVEIIVEMKQKDAWVGLVLGGSAGGMGSDDDMPIFFADGADSYFKDYTGVGYRAPGEDAEQNLLDHPDHNVDVDANTGIVTVFARRALDTGDSNDYLIQLDKSFNLGYAYNGSSSKM